MNYKFHLYYISLIGIIILLFSIRECNNQKNVNNLINQISNYSDSAKYYKSVNGNLIAYNSILKVQNEKQLKSILENYQILKDEIKKIKKIQNVTNINHQTIIKDTVEIPKDSIPCDFNPFTIYKKNNYFQFKGILSKDNLIIDSLVIPNQMSIILGKRKIGFLKYEEQVNVINSNPHIIVTNLSNIQVEQNKEWWEKGWVKISAGLLIGYGIATYQNNSKK
jgi:hypothetical protein